MLEIAPRIVRDGLRLQPLESFSATFDRLREADLVGGGQQRYATDLAQIQWQSLARALDGGCLEGRRVRPA
jgi:hypothetical protein